MLTVVLIILVILMFGGGFSTRGHPRFGSYSTSGIGLGGVLLIVLIVLLLTGRI